MKGSFEEMVAQWAQRGALFATQVAPHQGATVAPTKGALQRHSTPVAP
jgi:hypothetical protein